MLKQRCQNVLKKYFNLEILHRKTAFGSSCSNLGLNSLSIILKSNYVHNNISKFVASIVRVLNILHLANSLSKTTKQQHIFNICIVLLAWYIFRSFRNNYKMLLQLYNRFFCPFLQIFCEKWQIWERFRLTGHSQFFVSVIFFCENLSTDFFSEIS